MIGEINDSKVRFPIYDNEKRIICDYVDIEVAEYNGTEELVINILHAIELTHSVFDKTSALSYGGRENFPYDYSPVVYIWYKILQNAVQEKFVPILKKEFPNFKSEYGFAISGFPYEQFTMDFICDIVTRYEEEIVQQDKYLKNKVDFFVHGDFWHIKSIIFDANRQIISKEKLEDFFDLIFKNLKIWITKC